MAMKIFNAPSGVLSSIGLVLISRARLHQEIERAPVILQLRHSIEKAMAQGRTNAAMALAGEQRHTRTTLRVERMAAGKVLADLKVERARIEGAGKKVEADLGPVKYLGALLDTDSDTALRWFILVVACLLDPLAVLLLLAATHD
jgi:hypothetical protein